MITLQVDQIDNYQRNAYGTTKWATDYAGRNPVEGVNGMIKQDGSFNPESNRVFGTAAHTLAALMAAVVHNLKQTRRARCPKKSNDIAADHAEQAIPDTTPHRAATTPTRADQATSDTTAASPTQRPGQSTPTRAPP